MLSETVFHLLVSLQNGEWISVTEQGKGLVSLHMTAESRVLTSEIHFSEKTKCHAAVICHFNVTDLLSHSDVFDRTSSLIGFQTVRNKWGGYSQSERKIKVSETKTNQSINDNV